MKEANKTRTCAERIGKDWARCREDLQILFAEYHNELTAEQHAKFIDDHGTEPDPSEPRLYHYGLSFDYVEPATFPDQTEGYFRYQLSWGAPANEIRFYSDRSEYWFMDWYDSASINIDGDYVSSQVREFFDDYDVGMMQQ